MYTRFNFDFLLTIRGKKKKKKKKKLKTEEMSWTKNALISVNNNSLTQQFTYFQSCKQVHKSIISSSYLTLDYLVCVYPYNNVNIVFYIHK